MEKTKFINLIDSLGAIAAKDNWLPAYDRRLDQFYWHKNPLSENVSLIKVSHETSLYLNKRGGIEGVLVEYLEDNFVEHNPMFASFTRSFKKKIDDSLFTIFSKDLPGAKQQLFGLVEALRADIYKDALEKDYSVGDLSKLTSFALSNQK